MAGTEKELKVKAEEVSKELNELSEAELEQVAGGLPQIAHRPGTEEAILGNNPYGIISAGH